MASGAERLLDPGDREYVARIADPGQRRVVVETLLRRRAPERLREGDPVPAVELLRLEPRGPVRVDELVAGRPAVLVFGSYT